MNQIILDLHKKAEVKYLDDQELDQISNYVYSLSKRIELYKLIESLEIEIFQLIANQLNNIFVEEEPEKIELALKYWIEILRSWSMAVILEDENHLNDNVINWLLPQIKCYQISILSNKILSFLQKNLSKRLSPNQYLLIKPYIEKTEKKLVNPDHNP